MMSQKTFLKNLCSYLSGKHLQNPIYISLFFRKIYANTTGKNYKRSNDID